MSCHPPARQVGPFGPEDGLTTGEQERSPYADLHVKPYANRHLKVYADNSVGTSDDAATELAEAVAHFFRGRRYVDPFGQSTVVAYDAHDLLQVSTQDTLGNAELAANDYRVLQAAMVTDPNGNRSAVAFDALGRVVATAVMGKAIETVGDSLNGVVADLTDAAVAAHVSDPLANPLAVLGHATTRLVYDLHGFVRAGLPAVVSTLARRTHHNDPAGATSEVYCCLSYSDGFGEEIQRKHQAEGNRWVVSGWKILDNKRNPVRQFEPFFDATPGFVFGTTVGVSSTLCYDLLGRVVAVVEPNHAWRKVVFDPWRQETWDGNDTALVVDPANDPNVGDSFRRLPDALYLPTWHAARAGGSMGMAEQDAATKTVVHAATPALAAVDSRGRVFLGVAHDKVGGADRFYRTRVVLDVEGNVRAEVDGRDRVVAWVDVDLLGNRLSVSSMEAGPRRWLSDVTGKPIRLRDGRGHAMTWTYDQLRRPLRRTVRGTDPARSDPQTVAGEVVYERFEYGEGRPNAAAQNLRTRVASIFDGAGVESFEYDFKGNIVHGTRQFVDHRSVPNWADTPALEANIWHHRATFDALNRATTATAPDGSVTRFAYSPRKLVVGIGVDVRGGASTTPFVSLVEYDARGWFTRIDFGNGARTTYDYDPLTFRTRRVVTTRGSAGSGTTSQLFVDPTQVQDLQFAYDPAGNVTRLLDAALRTIFFQNAQVEPVNSYTYDPVYRLIEAQGREHVGQSAFAAPATGRHYRDHPFVGASQLGDPVAVRTYREIFTYDAVGNIESVTHAGGFGGWTRTYAYNEPSLLDGSAMSNRLTSTTTGSGTESYAYDEHGSVMQMPHLPLLEWDFRGRLRASSRQVVNGSIAQEKAYYQYAANGDRLRVVTERAGGSRRAERRSVRGSEVYREYAGDGQTVIEARETLHVMAGARRIALVETKTVGTGVLGTPVPVARYQFGDHLDSAMLELDGGGDLISYEQFTAYGNPAYQAGRSAAEVSLKRYRYTGRERDDETGFACHGARYYAPWLGRWTACDPAGTVDGPNLYQYARSNPCRLRDPTGRQSEEDEGRTPTPPSAQAQAGSGAATAAVRERAGGQGAGGPGEGGPGEGGPGGPNAPPSSTGAVGDSAGRPAGSASARQSDDIIVGNESGVHLRIGRGLQGTTKMVYPHWPGMWLTVLVAAALLVPAGLLVGFQFGRRTTGDPTWYNVVKIGATITLGAWVGTQLAIEHYGVLSKEAQSRNDASLVDPFWTPIHTFTGVVLGLWHVPFPVVAAATMLWELVEVVAPGFGDKEINANRMTDIGVAWGGWALASGITAYLLGVDWAFGLRGRDYGPERDRAMPRI